MPGLCPSEPCPPISASKNQKPLFSKVLCADVCRRSLLFWHVPTPSLALSRPLAATGSAQIDSRSTDSACEPRSVITCFQNWSDEGLEAYRDMAQIQISDARRKVASLEIEHEGTRSNPEHAGTRRRLYEKAELEVKGWQERIDQIKAFFHSYYSHH